MCPRCQRQVHCISAGWAPKKLYLCRTCQEVRQGDELRLLDSTLHRAQHLHDSAALAVR